MRLLVLAFFVPAIVGAQQPNTAPQNPPLPPSVTMPAPVLPTQALDTASAPQPSAPLTPPVKRVAEPTVPDAHRTELLNRQHQLDTELAKVSHTLDSLSTALATARQTADSLSRTPPKVPDTLLTQEVLNAALTARSAYTENVAKSTATLTLLSAQVTETAARKKLIESALASLKVELENN